MRGKKINKKKLNDRQECYCTCDCSFRKSGSWNSPLKTWKNKGPALELRFRDSAWIHQLDQQSETDPRRVWLSRQTWRLPEPRRRRRRRRREIRSFWNRIITTAFYFDRSRKSVNTNGLSGSSHEEEFWWDHRVWRWENLKSAPPPSHMYGFPQCIMKSRVLIQLMVSQPAGHGYMTHRRRWQEGNN